MIWKKIEEFPDYEISNFGLVKSVSRKIVTTAGWTGTLPHKKTIKERILKPALTQNGYLFVTLRKNNSHSPSRIHHLVTEAFFGKRPIGLVVNHINGIKTDNKISNLEYCTKSKNTQEHYKSIGKRTGFIPYADIPAILKRISEGEEIQTIAKEYNVMRNDVAVINKIIALTGKELEINL